MFTIVRTQQAESVYQDLKEKAAASLKNRTVKKRAKASPTEGLFKQIKKTLDLIAQNPRHPGLKTHQFSGYDNPYDAEKKVFEAYVQNNTPGAYRVFWCYGPGKGELTIIAITPHP